MSGVTNLKFEVTNTIEIPKGVYEIVKIEKTITQTTWVLIEIKTKLLLPYLDSEETTFWWVRLNDGRVLQSTRGYKSRRGSFVKETA